MSEPDYYIKLIDRERLERFEWEGILFTRRFVDLFLKMTLEDALREFNIKLSK